MGLLHTASIERLCALFAIGLLMVLAVYSLVLSLKHNRDEYDELMGIMSRQRDDTERLRKQHDVHGKEKV